MLHVETSELNVQRAVGFKLSEGMDVPAERASKFTFARQKSKLAGTIRGSYSILGTTTHRRAALRGEPGPGRSVSLRSKPLPVGRAAKRTGYGQARRPCSQFRLALPEPSFEDH